MTRETRARVGRALFLIGVLWIIAVLCMGCGSVDQLFNTVQAVLGGLGVVLATVGALLPPAESAAIQTGVTLVSDAVEALHKAVDDYERDKATGTGVVAAIEAALKSVEDNLQQLLAAAKIKDEALQAWITKVVTVVGRVVEQVATQILPAVKAGALNNRAEAERLEVRVKAQAQGLKAEFETSLAGSGLSPEAIKAGIRHVEHKTRRHFGPISF